LAIDLLGFIAIAIVVIVTPGQDTALTVRNTLAGGRAAGVATAAGVSLGQLAWTAAASLGLTAILLASEPLFNAIRLLGAGYLVILGVSALVAAVRANGGSHIGADPIRRLDARAAGRQGVLSNLSNAKMAVFFTSLLPQFVPAGEGAFIGMLALGTLFAAMTFGWLSLYALVVDRASGFIQRSTVRRLMDALLGTVLIALGIRVAVVEQ
jgi:threonine/homoserine/homoserine lactone efflux protein